MTRARILRMAPSLRAISYCVPLAVLLLPGADLWHWPLTAGARVALGVALAGVLVIELVIDRFRITLEDDRLIYRYIGFPIYARRILRRASIVHVRCDFAGPVSSSWRTDTLELTIDADEGLEKTTLVMRTFSAADRAALFEWLNAKRAIPLDVVQRRW